MEEGSYWIQAVIPKSTHPPLTTNSEADVVVIGGGITGITTAYLLSKSGMKVILLEKGPLYSGETAYTTAFLTIYPDIELTQVKDTWDIEKVKWVLKSQEEAIQLIEQIAIEEQIECEFKRTSVFIYTQKQEDIEKLQKESEIAAEAGYTFPFKQESDVPFDNAGYVELPNQAKFHPLKYLSKLAQIIENNGVEIYEDTMVTKIEDVDNGVEVYTEKATIKAEYAVMATHNTFGGPFLVQNELQQYNTYVIGLELDKPELKEQLYWDTEDPYNYIRIDKTPEGKTLLILGGADHKTGEEGVDPEEKYALLENYIIESLPGVEYTMKYKWSGQVIETTDGLPFIGFLPEMRNTLVATGFAGNGMTFGTISARIITDLIKGNENQLTDLYTLKRLKNVKSLAKKGAHVLKEYSRKYLGEFEDIDETSLQNNAGKVVEVDGKKVAVYKSEDGSITKVSAVCTHLGCIVNWNGDQQSWDCPCHGSRFTKEGEVISGPATKPLEKYR